MFSRGIEFQIAIRNVVCVFPVLTRDQEIDATLKAIIQMGPNFRVGSITG